MAEIIDVDFAAPVIGPDEPGLRVRRRYQQGCTHRYVVIDEITRCVDCRECKAQLDPVSVLIDWATQWESYANGVRRSREDLTRLEEQRETLRREVASLKAMKRRAEEARKVGVEVVEVEP